MHHSINSYTCVDEQERKARILARNGEQSEMFCTRWIPLENRYFEAFGIEEKADIVITSNGGYPLDQNIYQSVKGMTAGEAVCRPGGVIILSASCCDGHGGKDFCQALTEASSVPQFLREIERIPRNKTEQDQWQYQILLRILEKFKVIMVTRDCDHEMIKAMKLDVASSIDEALSMAYQIVGNSAKVAVIPDGVSVVAAKL